MKHSLAKHTVPRETFAHTDELMQKCKKSLEAYLDQLLWWNRRVNLVSRNVSRGTVWEHVRHSLLIHKFALFQNSPLVVDAGTGGGLPGIPLAVTHPDKRFILNDIVTKKVLALKQMLQKIEVGNAETAAASIEELNVQKPFLLISKHAFKINDLFEMTSHLPWTGMVFYKGLDFEEELSGIDTPLSIEAYDLFPYSENEFYRDKALVVVQRENDDL